AAWVRDLSKETAADEAQRLGVPLVAVNEAADLHRAPQYVHRGFFSTVSHPVLGDAAYPTVPYRFGATPAEIVSAAPTLGQHTASVLGG
ncbi:CoA transferase, partial [Mycobacterium kansasii]